MTQIKCLYYIYKRCARCWSHQLLIVISSKVGQSWPISVKKGLICFILYVWCNYIKIECNTFISLSIYTQAIIRKTVIHYPLYYVFINLVLFPYIALGHCPPWQTTYLLLPSCAPQSFCLVNSLTLYQFQWKKVHQVPNMMSNITKLDYSRTQY